LHLIVQPEENHPGPLNDLTANDTNRSESALEIWREYNGRATVECRIDELKNELAADHFCLRSFFATESAFLAVLFGFNLLSEFQRAVDPALKAYKQPATLYRGGAWTS
jgi:hypothetical protein